MSDQKQIKYIIEKAGKYSGEGKIDYIKNKILNKYFQLYSDSDLEFELDLKFEAPSILTEINLRFINTQKYQITLIDTKNKELETIKKNNDGKDSQAVVKPRTSEPVRYARVKLINNYQFTERLGIRYILFYGLNELEEKSTSKNKVKNTQIKDNRKISEFVDVDIKINLRNDQRATESKAMFNTRDRSKIKAEVDKLTDFTQFDAQITSIKIQRRNQSLEKYQKPPRRKVKRNEDEDFISMVRKNELKQKRLREQEKQQTDLAIALSKSVEQTYELEYEKMEIQEDPFQSHEERLPEQLENYYEEKIGKMQQEPERTYRTETYHEDYIELFANVSPEWFEMQRKAQIENNVREEERLTNFIKIKWLYGMEVYISGFQNWRMDELQHQAKTLGCEIIDQVKNHALAIVPKPLCQKLRKKHSSWKEVKYLTPNYLQDCINKQQRLHFKEYYIKV